MLLSLVTWWSSRYQNSYCLWHPTDIPATSQTLPAGESEAVAFTLPIAPITFPIVAAAILPYVTEAIHLVM